MPITGAIENIKLINSRPNGTRTTDANYTDNWVYFTQGRVKFQDKTQKNEFSLVYVIEVSTTTNAVIGQTITGGTSLETAIIVGISTNFLYVNTVSGAFTNGETITHAGYSATVVDQPGVGISGGQAVVEYERTATSQFDPIPNKKGHAMFEAYIASDPTYQLKHAIKILDVTGTKKVYIEYPDTNVEDMSLNTDTNGLNIAEIKSTTLYPSHTNYVPLWSITGGLWESATDDRELYMVDGKYVNNDELIKFIQDGTINYAVTTGTLNNYEALYDPIPDTVLQSAVYYGKAHQTNSGTSFFTLQTTGGPVTAEIKKFFNDGLSSGDIENGQHFAVKYDGTYFQLITPTSTIGTAITNESVITGEFGEDAFVGQPGFVGTGLARKRFITQSNTGTDTLFGNIPYIYIHQMYIAQKDNVVSQLRIRLRKVGAPVDNVRVRIYEENHTTLVATATNVINGGTITLVNAFYDFFFSDVALDVNKKYWFEIGRDGPVNVANYYVLDGITSNFGRERGDQTGWDGLTHQYINGAIYHQVYTKKNYDLNKWYLSDSDFVDTGKVNGIFSETKNAGDTGFITVSGANQNQVLQKSGKEHFISNAIYGLNQLQHNTNFGFGYQLNNQEKCSQGIILTKGIHLQKISLFLGKVGLPTDEATIRIETDNNGAPSGVQIANGNINVAGVNLGSQPKTYYLEFPADVNLMSDTRYWIVLGRSGAYDTSNYYTIGIINSVQYQFGNFQSKNATWTNQVASMAFDLMTQYNNREYLQQNITTQINIGNSASTNLSQGTPLRFDTDTSIRGVMVYLQKTGNPVDNTVLNLCETLPYRYYSFYGTLTQSFGQTGSYLDATQPVAIQSETASTVDITKITLDVTNDFPANNLDNIVIRIETDASGNPSGVLAHPNATFTILNANIPLSRRPVDYNFAGTVTLNTNTRYHVRFSRTVPIAGWYYSIYATNPSLTYDSAKRYNTVGMTRDNLNGNITLGFPELDAPDTNNIVATASIANSSLVAGARRRIYFDFGAFVNLDRNKRYWIQVKRSGVVDAANYPMLGLHTTNSFYNKLFTESCGYYMNYGLQMVYHVLEKYMTPAGNITLHPPLSQITTNISNFEKVGDSVSESTIVLDNNIKSINLSQVVVQNTTYYTGVGGDFSAGYTRIGGGVTTIQLSIGDDPTNLVTYAGTYSTANSPVGLSVYIPKGKYWSFSIAGVVSTGNAYFYLK